MPLKGRLLQGLEYLFSGPIGDKLGFARGLRAQAGRRLVV